tara:strand:+ start:1794 stop:2078 length:285 start_codon:yes stop_codon:yes gene_type:complete
MGEKNDRKIIQDRAEKYGDPKDFFPRYGQMCEILRVHAVQGQKEVNQAHLQALEMVLLKALRSAWNPQTSDNYCDLRNYGSIAEMQVTLEVKGR